MHGQDIALPPWGAPLDITAENIDTDFIITGVWAELAYIECAFKINPQGKYTLM